MTFEDMNTYLEIQFGNRADLKDFNSTNLYEVWINIAYMELTTQNRFWAVKKNIKFPELLTLDTTQSTVDGVAYIDVPSDAVVVHNLIDTSNDRGLDRITPAIYFDYTDRSDTGAEGEPVEYTRTGDYLYLHPTPDDAYTTEILYRKRPAALTDTNTTVIGEEWDNAILTLAAYTGFSWIGEPEKAKASKAEFMEILAGRVGIYDQEEKDSNNTLHADPSGKDYSFG